MGGIWILKGFFFFFCSIHFLVRDKVTPVPLIHKIPYGVGFNSQRGRFNDGKMVIDGFDSFLEVDPLWFPLVKTWGTAIIMSHCRSHSSFSSAPYHGFTTAFTTSLSSKNQWNSLDESTFVVIIVKTWETAIMSHYRSHSSFSSTPYHGFTTALTTSQRWENQLPRKPIKFTWWIILRAYYLIFSTFFLFFSFLFSFPRPPQAIPLLHLLLGRL